MKISIKNPDSSEIWEYIDNLVAEGKTIDPSWELPSRVDKSELDNLDKIIKAIGLTIAEVSGRTPLQIKTIFKQKYDTL